MAMPACSSSVLKYGTNLCLYIEATEDSEIGGEDKIRQRFANQAFKTYLKSTMLLFLRTIQ